MVSISFSGTTSRYPLHPFKNRDAINSKLDNKYFFIILHVYELETDIQTHGIGSLDRIVKPVFSQFHIPNLEIANTKWIIRTQRKFHILQFEFI